MTPNDADDQAGYVVFGNDDPAAAEVEKVIEGRLDRKGQVRPLKDPQRMYNYNSSAQVEGAALATNNDDPAAAEAARAAEAWQAIADRVSVRVTACEVAVFIDGLPHLLIRRKDITALQSYIKSHGAATPIYFIEISTASHDLIVSDYDDMSLWKQILQALGEAKIFDEMLGENGYGSRP